MIIRDILQLTERISFSYYFVLDIDECSSNSHSCDVNAVCYNIQGTYTCACKAGYSGDGKSCIGKLIQTLALFHS